VRSATASISILRLWAASEAFGFQRGQSARFPVAHPRALQRARRCPSMADKAVLVLPRLTPRPRYRFGGVDETVLATTLILAASAASCVAIPAAAPRSPTSACDGHRHKMERKRMPMEFLHGRPLNPGDPEMIRRQVEEFEVVAAVDDKIRGIVARNWPHLLSKLPPEEDRRGRVSLQNCCRTRT
jgi:hypothetical protein